MALPTAPLGQLPSMSMPYSIPNYDQGPKLWERALMQFLGGVAQQAGGQIMDNVLARDFSDEPARGMDRFLRGPKVDARLHQQNQAQEHDLMLENARLENRRGMALDEQLTGDRRQSLDLASREALSGEETMRQNAAIGARRDMGIEDDERAIQRLMLADSLQREGQLESDTRRFGNEVEAAGIKARMMSPLDEATMRRTQAIAEGQEIENAQNRAFQLRTQQDGTGASGVDPRDLEAIRALRGQVQAPQEPVMPMLGRLGPTGMMGSPLVQQLAQLPNGLDLIQAFLSSPEAAQLTPETPSVTIPQTVVPASQPSLGPNPYLQNAPVGAIPTGNDTVETLRRLLKDSIFLAPRQPLQYSPPQ